MEAIRYEGAKQKRTTGIEWATETWNPFVGCTVKSSGCKNCYAMRLAERLELMGQKAYAGTTKRVGPNTVWSGRINASSPATWERPERVKEPSIFFVNSMSDFFHESVDWKLQARALELMAGWPRHQFQVLTKRPENILPVLKKCGNRERFPDNVWIGATVEDARVRERIDFVRWFPARIKFLSVEPLIAPLLAVDFSGIDWVITGGESGPGARYMDADWVREVHDLCRKYGAKHFFKQYGQVKNNPLYKQAIDGISGAVWVKRNDPIGKGGSKLDGVYIKEMPDGFEVPAFDEAFTDDKFKAT